MIHFDTNAMISLPLWAQDGHPVIRKVVDGEPAAVCLVAWYEFLIGLIERDEIDSARAFIQDRIVDVGHDDAALAARLFNAADRKRKLKTDALIAAAAIKANARFVTVNKLDFESFAGQGLRLLPEID